MTRGTAERSGRSAAPAAPILTPDRRLRVFVSSALHELAEERAAVKAAVESLRLTPILFELGARPHPPSSLYRAYLAQSEVFLGIYWQSGGWLAPGSDSSGIEDEYARAGGLPRLIYVKEPAPERDERLKSLLARIRADEEASYRPFTTAEELGRLVTDDLAVLITERFQMAAAPARSRPGKPAAGNLPAPATRLIDRADELALLRAFLADDDVRLTALTGTGGVGKTRIALEAAAAVAARFRDGVWLVPLADLSDPELVPAAILEVLRVPAGGRRPIEAVKAHLRSRQHLLVLDNFEQVLGAAPLLAELISAAPGVKIVVTSRASLHLRAEHEVPVAPLRVPGERAAAEEVGEAPAVHLFLDRVRAVRPGFEPAPADAAAIATIVRRLDGVPLAIELAASRCRLLTPAELLARLAATLDLGAGVLRDLPDRQRTLRATIRWSFDLLEERERRLFLRLSVFRHGFTVEGAGAVCGGLAELELLDALEALVDSSLVTRAEGEEGSRYGMLEIVGEFADELLAESGQAPEARALHAGFISRVVADAGGRLNGPGQPRALRLLELEYNNIAAAMDWYLECQDVDALAGITWEFWSYWWFYGRLEEGARRARIALSTSGCSPAAEARLTAVLGILAAWQGDVGTAMPALAAARDAFHRLGDTEGEALILVIQALATWGFDPAGAEELIRECRPLFTADHDRWGLAICANVIAWLSPATEADGEPSPHMREALELSEASGDNLNLGMALANLAAQDLELGRLADGREHLRGSLRFLSELRERYAITTTLELAGLAVAESGDGAAGARLLGAADGMRAWLQVPVLPAQAGRHDRLVAGVRRQVDPQEFDRLWAEGKALDYDAAVALAAAALAGA